MADAKDETKSTGAGGKFMRWVGLGNEAIGNAVRGLVMIPGHAVDLINNAPRILTFGYFGKMSEKPFLGSDQIAGWYDRGKKATDDFTGAQEYKPETVGEHVFSKSVEIGAGVVLGGAAVKGAQGVAQTYGLMATPRPGMVQFTGRPTNPGDISAWKARDLAGGDKSFVSKLEMLSGKGPKAEAQIDRLFSQMRASGIEDSVYRQTVEALRKGGTNLPPETAARYADRMTEMFRSQQGITGIIDKLSGKFAYAADYPGSTALDLGLGSLKVAKWGLTTKTGLATSTALGTGGYLTLNALGSDEPQTSTMTASAPRQVAAATPPSTASMGARMPAGTTTTNRDGTDTPAQTSDTKPADTQQTQGMTSPAPAAAPVLATGGATPSAPVATPALSGGDIGGEISALAGNFSKATGLDGMWNSGFMRGIRRWADQNQGISKPLFALGGALLATKLFLGDGVKSVLGDGFSAKIATFVLFGAVAWAIGSQFDSAMNHGKSPTAIAFGNAVNAPPGRDNLPDGTPDTAVRRPSPNPTAPGLG